MLRMTPRALALISLLPLSLPAQSPPASYADAIEGRAGRGQPVIHYVVRADLADRSALAVEMQLRNAPDTLHLRIPVWAPGAYRLAYFGRNVRGSAVGTSPVTTRQSAGSSNVTWAGASFSPSR